MRAVVGRKRLTQPPNGVLRPPNPLGTEEFVAQIAPLLNGQVEDFEFNRNERLLSRPSLATIFSKVRDKSSRNECIHHAMRIHEYTLKEIANFTGLHYSTISVIAKRVDQDKHQI